MGCRRRGLVPRAEPRVLFPPNLKLQERHNLCVRACECARVCMCVCVYVSLGSVAATGRGKAAVTHYDQYGENLCHTDTSLPHTRHRRHFTHQHNLLTTDDPNRPATNKQIAHRIDMPSACSYHIDPTKNKSSRSSGRVACAGAAVIEGSPMEWLCTLQISSHISVRVCRLLGLTMPLGYTNNNDDDRL